MSRQSEAGGNSGGGAATARTRTLGSLHEFRPDSEDFSTYMERVEIYFAANDVPENKQVPVFLNAIGGEYVQCATQPPSP